jgi:hypothetical protein
MAADLMAAPQQFRKFADICIRMANEPDGAKHKAQLMEMAETWRALAEEAERFEQLVLEMDQAFDTREPEQSAPRVQRRSH